MLTLVAASLAALSLPLAQTKPSATHAYPWVQQWYALAHEDALDTTAPSSHMLLEVPIVLWYADGKWHAAHDACPHRGSPLSNGLVDSSLPHPLLTCRYHGWQFDGDGSTVGDPQGTRPPKCGLRMRAVAKCSRGIVWVWGDDDSEPFGGPPEPQGLLKGLQPISDCTSILFPAPFYALVENSVDAAHGVHAHHGILGRREQARPYAYASSGERERQAEAFKTWLITPTMTGPNAGAGAIRSSLDIYSYSAPQQISVWFGGAGLGVEAFVTPVSSEETLFVSTALSGEASLVKLSSRIRSKLPHVFTHRLKHRTDHTLCSLLLASHEL